MRFMAEAKKRGRERQRKSLKFHYIKSQAFRTIHVDGMIGGPRPKGNGFAFAVFSERMPLPQITEQLVTAEGQLGELVAAGTVTKDGLIRELEAFLTMDVETAIRVHEWLGKQLEGLAKITAARQRAMKGKQRG